MAEETLIKNIKCVKSTHGHNAIGAMQKNISKVVTLSFL